jgi:8-oxo-dGTP diphosphatase
MEPSTPVNVCCAIIEHEGKILIAQRGVRMNNPGKWEFPGGKIEPGETPEQCLKREIQEELDLKICITGSLSPVTYKYPDKTITLIPFICKSDCRLPNLSEHQNVAWISPEVLDKYDCSAADIIVGKNYIISKIL